MTKVFALIVSLLLFLPATRGLCENLTLNRLGDEETGLRAIMETWRAEELERQGGKFGSHGWWPWGLVAFDFDNDGDLDLLASHHGTPGGRLFKNLLKEQGKVSFADISKSIADERLPGADDRPWIWDFDGDGWLDIAGFSDESKPRSFFNMAGKRFVPIPNFTFSPVAHATEVIDLNGNGYPDLLTISRGGIRRHLFDPDKRTFAVKTAFAEGEPVPDVCLTYLNLPEGFADWFAELKKKSNNRFLGYNITKAELNGDGTQDIVIACYGGYGGDALGKYYIVGEDGKTSDGAAKLGLPETGVPILVQDLTGNGAPEVLVASSEGAGLYLNDGQGRFSLREGHLSAFLRQRDPYRLKALPADLDNDGDLDLVVSMPRKGAMRVFENTGGGEFGTVLSAKGWDSNPIVICDIDNDGLLDVVVGGPRDTISLYLSSAAKPGRYARIFPRMSAPNPFAVGARVEVFEADTLARPGARPLWVQQARHDGQGVHVGLGERQAFDLRVTFPGKDSKVVEQAKLTANDWYRVTSGGVVSCAPDR